MYRFPEPKKEEGRRRRLSSRRSTAPVTKPMTVKSFQRKMDQQLPTAQTCFFDLYLPSYSSEKIMKERLLTAISFESFNLSETIEKEEVGGTGGTKDAEVEVEGKKDSDGGDGGGGGGGGETKSDTVLKRNTKSGIKKKNKRTREVSLKKESIEL